ncbi:hypothetical protein [Streptomyces exfoliatus]|uniref:hypothetical protein n=1 Tax=Streptomyces exfoliatus TaxID=1905 RepID=UPI003C2E9E84
MRLPNASGAAVDAVISYAHDQFVGSGAQLRGDVDLEAVVAAAVAGDTGAVDPDGEFVVAGAEVRLRPGGRISSAAR